MANRVSILGGGFTGLTSAHLCSEKGLKSTVFEASNRLGGRVWSDSFGNVPVEFGAQFVGKGDASVYGLLKDLGLEKELAKFALSDFKVMGSEVFEGVKLKEVAGLTSAELKGFFDFTAEVDFEKFLEDHTEEVFSEWYYDSFGGEYAWFVDVLCRSITFSKASELSAPFGLAAVSSFFGEVYGFKKGFNVFNEALKARCSCDFVLNARVASIDLERDDRHLLMVETQRGEEYMSNPIVSCLPAGVLGSVVSDKSLSAKLKAVEYSSCFVLDFVCNRDVLDGAIGLILPSIQVPVVFDNARKFGLKSKNQVLTAFLVSDRALSNEEALKLGAEELEKVLPGFSEWVVESRAFFWKDALPVCSPKLFDLQEDILSFECNDFRLAGDYLNLPSLDGCVYSAKHAVSGLSLK